MAKEILIAVEGLATGEVILEKEMMAMEGLIVEEEIVLAGEVISEEEVISAVVPEKCIKQYVRNARKNAKYRSSRPKEEMFFAKIVLSRENRI